MERNGTALHILTVAVLDKALFPALYGTRALALILCEINPVDMVTAHFSAVPFCVLQALASADGHLTGPSRVQQQLDRKSHC
jgi:hypothetical protein